MTNQNPPPPDAGMERAVEAALPIMRRNRCGSDGVLWCGAEADDCYCRVATVELITAADRARGRSHITWRRPEEYEQSPSRWVFIRRELAVDRLPPETFHTGGNSLHLNVIAFAEMAAPPAWSETLARTATDGDRSPGPAPFSTEVAKALDFLSDYILGGEGVHDDLSEARAAFRLVDNHVRGKFIAPSASTREHPWWMLRMLVDKAWQKATESSEVPSTKMSDTIIEIIFGPYVAPAISPSTHDTPGAAVLAGGESFQAGVHKWLLACFGPEIAADKIERNHRFLEEALELVQSAGCTDSEAHQLVDYVFSRPVGEIEQEIGGVMNTLAALCLAHGFDMVAAGDKEMRRVWTMVDKIRAKQAAKPKHSPLPEHTLPAEPTLPRTSPRLELMQSLAPRDLPPAEREVWAEHRLRELDATWVLDEKDSAAFVAAALDPPAPNEALKAAAERYKSSDFTVPAPRPEWTAEKESLLRMISNSVWFLLREKSTAHTIHDAIEAAFPEPTP